MKINFTANRRGNQSWLNSFFDFFFPIEERIRFEAGTTLFVNRDGSRKVYREFGTFRSFFWHYVLILPSVFKNFFVGYMISLAVLFNSDPYFSQRGAIAFDATSDSGDQANTTPWSWTHTSTGSNLTMAYDIQWWDNSGAVTQNTPTYNSVNLVQDGDVKENNVYVNHAAMWHLANPTTGANTVSQSFSSGSYGRAGTQTFSGTRTNSPIDVSGTNFGNSASASVSVTTNNVNSFLVDCMSAVDNDPNVPTAGGSQTVNWSSGTRSHGSSRKTTTTAGSQTMSWTLTVNPSRWAMAVIAINELPVGGSRRLMGVGI